MKRALAGVLSLIFIAGGSLRAADAVALAAQQEVVESYKRLTATIEDLQNTQAAQRKEMESIRSDLNRLREEISRNSASAANKEAIDKLKDQIAKVDDTRLADNHRFQEALERLGETFKKSINSRPARAVDLASNNRGPVPHGAGGPGGNGGTEEGFEYIVVAGDRPDKIAAKYQAEKINVTSADIIKGNPSVDWTKLKIGQKLFIPKPK